MNLENANIDIYSGSALEIHKDMASIFSQLYLNIKTCNLKKKNKDRVFVVFSRRQIIKLFLAPDRKQNAKKL